MENGEISEEGVGRGFGVEEPSRGDGEFCMWLPACQDLGGALHRSGAGVLGKAVPSAPPPNPFKQICWGCG